MIVRWKGIVDISSALLMCAAAIAVFWRVLLHAPQASPPPSPPPLVEAVKDLRIAANDVTHARGRGNVVLVEFADYECPYCASHAQTTAPRIQRELIDSGRVQHVFFNFPLPIHPRAPKAGEAAECAAAQGRFWDMYERLFENTAVLDVPDLLQRADAIGLDMRRFTACLHNGDTADRIQHDVEVGRALGVRATPAFFVGTRDRNGTITITTRIRGALPFEVFDDALREQLRITLAASSR